MLADQDIDFLTLYRKFGDGTKTLSESSIKTYSDLS